MLPVKEALILAETKPTRLDNICSAISAQLIGNNTINGKVIEGDQFWKDLLFDADQDKCIIYDYSFLNKIAKFDPCIAIFNTNKETYDRPTNGGYVSTIGLVYIEILIRNQEPGKADMMIGRLQDKLRSLLMTNSNFYGQTDTWFFTGKETLIYPEKTSLYTRIGRQTIECRYNPQVVYQRR